MGFFDKLFGKNKETEQAASDVNGVYAPVSGDLFDVTTLKDPVFSQKMMGESVAFRVNEDSAEVCAPASGTLGALFPTGHAFGVKMADGTELLVHIGIDTVEANGDGFTLLGKKQGDAVQAGEPVVKVDFKKLAEKYDMSVILVITDQAGHARQFIAPATVKKGDSVLK